MIHIRLKRAGRGEAGDAKEGSAQGTSLGSSADEKNTPRPPFMEQNSDSEFSVRDWIARVACLSFPSKNKSAPRPRWENVGNTWQTTAKCGNKCALKATYGKMYGIRRRRRFRHGVVPVAQAFNGVQTPNSTKSTGYDH